MTCFFSVVVVVCFDILDRNVAVYIVIDQWTREVPILTQLSPAGSRFSHQIYSMQNGQRPRQKERKKKKNQQFRTVEFWIITSVRSARAEQNSQLSFFFKFPLDDRQLCLDRLSTNGRLEGGWLASNDMHRHRSTTFLLIPRSNNPTTNFDIV